MVSAVVLRERPGVGKRYGVRLRSSRPWPWHAIYETFNLEHAVAMSALASNVVRSALDNHEPRSTAVLKAMDEVDRYITMRGWDDPEVDPGAGQ